MTRLGKQGHHTRPPWEWRAAEGEDEATPRFLVSPNALSPNENVGPIIMDTGIYQPMLEDSWLIKAAPDLYEALKELLDQCGHAGTNLSAMDVAERALGKAEGKS